MLVPFGAASERNFRLNPISVLQNVASLDVVRVAALLLGAVTPNENTKTPAETIPATAARETETINLVRVSNVTLLDSGRQCVPTELLLPYEATTPCAVALTFYQICLDSSNNSGPFLN
jgi:hypothetical protein